MPASRFRLPRPEGGAEAGVTFARHHECASARHMRAALDDDDADLITFPVGHAGQGIPSDTPFTVTAIEPCGVCGKLLVAWFEWVGPSFHSVSPLWTP